MFLNTIVVLIVLYGSRLRRVFFTFLQIANASKMKSVL